MLAAMHERVTYLAQSSGKEEVEIINMLSDHGRTV
jgi:hypothetical protein